MESSRQFEIRQEARFVLWALRCAVAHQHGDECAGSELQRGFELADVLETAHSFRGFATTLCSVRWAATVWHDPQCSCVSHEELLALQALADSAQRQRDGDGLPSPWWRVLVPSVSISAVDAAARSWLESLSAAGVVFPHPWELIESLGRLESIAGPAHASRLN